MKKSFSIALIMGSMLSLTALADAPNPREVTIRGITYGGTGCPSSTVASSISDDNKAFTLFFDQFVASAGGGVPSSEAYKVCNLSIDLHFPQGWSYSIVGVDYRGYAQLDRGVTASQRSEYWIQGVGTRRIPMRSDIRGPYANDYLYQDRLGVDATVWSPCGVNRALNVKASVAITGATATRSGLMTVDSIDGEVKHIYGIQWQRCR